MERAGLPFRRLPGVLGHAFPPELATYFEGSDDCLKAGEVGCYASHLLALREIASGACGPYAIVMEDDLEIASDFAQVILALLAHLPDGWDFVRLSNKPKRATVALATLPGGRALVKYSKVPNGAGAYLVSRAGARTFLDGRPRRHAVDEDLRRPWNYDFRVFGVTPPPAKQNCLPVSSIDTLEAGRLDGRGGTLGRLKRVRWNELWRRPLFNIRWLGLDVWSTCLARNIATRLGIHS